MAANERLRMNSLRVVRLSRIFLFRGPKWRGFGLYGFKLGFVGIVAVGAEEIGPFPCTGKKAGPLPMNPCTPSPVNVPMAFATEPIAFREIDEFPVIKPQFIPISCFVAVKAPSHCLSMMKFDIAMFILQLPLFSVHLHRGMAVATRKHALRHGRRGDGKLLTCTADKGDETGP